jgi:acetolactate synthase-1/2/3 large subunit
VEDNSLVHRSASALGVFELRKLNDSVLDAKFVSRARVAMKKTVGSYLIECLEARGVRHVFGIPGVHNLELYRGLTRSRIRHVTGRHEQGLGFMADGYARTTGRPGVCFTITGPGLTNIVTAMGQAYADSIPMVVISSENSRADIGTGCGHLHELPDQLGLAAKVSASAERVEQARDLHDVVARAFAAATGGRPRPVYIEIPRDVLAADARGLPAPASGQSPPPPEPATAESIAVAARRLRCAHSPVLLVGGGARGAAAEIKSLAEHLGAPVVMTINARGLLPPQHPLGVSMTASLAPVRAMIGAADTVLAVGTELGPTDYDMYAASELSQLRELIRIDVDEAELRRNARPALALRGHARETLRGILASGLGAVRAPWGEATVLGVRAEAQQLLSAPMRREIAFLEVIRDAVANAILVGDSTQPVYAGNLGFAAATPGSWFNSATGYGTLGYAVPASTGAGLGAPDRPIVCLVGDGGIQFSLGELAVPRDVDAWSVIVIWNNRGYAEIKTSMLAVDIEPEGVNVQPPDFSHLARAYGYGYLFIEDLESLERALRDFASRRQVLVLEIRAAAFE